MTDGSGEEIDGTVDLRRGVAPAPLSAVIRCVRGSATPASFALRSGSCRIGAAAENELVVDDKAVSRNHAELSLVPEGVTLRDLGSRNGSFYAGQRATEITLSFGNHFTLGATEFVIESDRDDLEATSAAGPSEYSGMIGKSASMRRLFGLMKRLEGSLVSVLIQGESGTGKELIARALHENSRLKGMPFVALNCGALDRSLVRSELFGYKKGAFTGAVSAGTGAFEEADGGTLFLDEIGELPLDVQPVLLRVLESGEFSRVGESTTRPAKVRVIAATNRKLKEDVDRGAFRSDLYYRLMVVELAAPPLRQRPEDIEVLAKHFCRELGIESLSTEKLSELKAREWPGNVRELKNVLMAFSAVGELSGGEIGAARGPSVESGSSVGTTDDLDRVLERTIDVTRPYLAQKDELLGKMTRAYLSALIRHTHGNRSEAARIAGIQRGYLRKLLEKFEISSDSD